MAEDLTFVTCMDIHRTTNTAVPITSYGDSRFPVTAYRLVDETASIASLALAIDKVNEINADFFFIGGDFVSDDPVDWEVWQLNLLAFKSQMAAVDSDIYFQYGHHDVYDHIDPADWDIMFDSGTGIGDLLTNDLENYFWMLDETRHPMGYTFIRQGYYIICLAIIGGPFFGLDTVGDSDEASGSDADTQLQWLKNRLADADTLGYPVLVFTHHTMETNYPTNYPGGVADAAIDGDLAMIEIENYSENYPNSPIISYAGHIHADDEIIIKPKGTIVVNQSGDVWTPESIYANAVDRFSFIVTKIRPNAAGPGYANVEITGYGNSIITKSFDIYMGV